MGEAHAEQSSTRWSAQRWAPWLVVAAFAVLCLRPMISKDAWWHLNYGRWTWENLALPLTDAFTWTHPGAPIRNVPWLSSLCFYMAALVAGVPGMVVVKGVAGGFCAGMSWLHARQQGCRWGWFAAVAMVAVWVLVLRLALLRALLTPFVLLPLMSWLWVRGREDWRWRWAIPAVVAIWSNSHGSYPVVVAWLGLTVVWPLLWDADYRKANLGRSLALLMAGFAATFASPTGWQTWAFIVESLTAGGQDAASGLNIETLPPDWHMLSTHYAPVLVLGVLCVPVVLGVSWKKHGHGMLFMVAMALLASLAQRYLALVALAALIYMPTWLNDLQNGARDGANEAVEPPITQWRRTGGWRTMVGVWILVLALSPFWSIWYYFTTGYTVLPEALGFYVQKEQYPDTAVRYLQAHKPKGKLYNDPALGGYIHWSVPDLPVFMDGRTNVLFSPQYYHQHYGQHVRGEGDLIKTLDGLDVSMALVYIGPFSDALWIDPRWVPVSYDERTALYLKRGAGNDALIDQTGYRVLHLTFMRQLVHRQWVEVAAQSPAFVTDLCAEARRATDALDYPAPFVAWSLEACEDLRRRQGSPQPSP